MRHVFSACVRASARRVGEGDEAKAWRSGSNSTERSEAEVVVMDFICLLTTGALSVGKERRDEM